MKMAIGDISALLLVFVVSWFVLTVSGSLCPEFCSCIHNNSIVDCSSRQLRTVPKLTNTVQVLLLDNNPLGTITNRDFAGLTNLKHLKIHKCNLTSISPGTFSDLSSLSNLVLSWNTLTELPRDLLPINNSLEYLLLDHNEMSLASMSPGLAGLNSLRFLDVSANDHLTDKEMPAVFARFINLQTLKMEDCQDLSLGQNFFSALEDISLENLSLRGSSLMNVSEDSMAPLSSLKTLNLDDCHPEDTKLIIEGLVNCTQLESISLNNVFTNPKRAIHKHLFSPLSKVPLKNLSFTGNYGAFSGTLQHKFFRPLHNVISLNLSNCGLHKIEADALHSLKRLKKLTLSSNMLTCFTLDECGFLHKKQPHVDTDDITFLDLSDNGIQTYSNVLTFRGSVFKSLRHLRLAHNKITHLHKGLFLKVDTLYRLDLSYNPIQHIEEDWLQGMDYLTYLYLNASYMLQTLPRNAFHGAKRLMYVDLTGSDLQYIHPEAFAGLSLLQGIYLRENALDDSSLNGIRFDTRYISKFDLGHNFLTSIPHFVQGQLNLSYLAMDYNSVTDINPLSNLTQLELLDLSFNSISHLCPHFFKQHPRLQRITFQGNPFHCGCDFVNFADLINSTGIVVIKQENHLCLDPKGTLGKSIFEFQPSHWDCKARHVAVPFLCILVMLLAFVALSCVRRIGCQSPHIECSRDCCTNCYFPLTTHTEHSDITEDLSRL